MQKIFTTGQVAKICKVAPRTVSKWFDTGRLKGYRIPGSQDRRIPREQLIKFLKDHEMAPELVAEMEAEDAEADRENDKMFGCFRCDGTGQICKTCGESESVCDGNNDDCQGGLVACDECAQ